MCGGGCLGGGAGGILGSLAGILLAPLTGGSSLLLGPLGGALGGFGGTALGDAITGQPFNLGQAALAGAGGALGGFGAGGGFGAIGDAISGVGGQSAAGVTGAIGGADGAGGLASIPEGWTGAAGGAGTLMGETGGASPALVSGEGSAWQNIPGVTSEAQAQSLGLPTAIGGDPPAAASGVGGAGGGSVLTLPNEGTAFPAVAGGTIDPNTGVPLGSAFSSSAADWTASGGAGGALSGTGPNAVDSGGLGSILKQLGAFYKDNKDAIGLGTLGLSLGKGLLGAGALPGEQQMANNSGLAGNIAGQFGTGGLSSQQQTAFNQNLQGTIAAIKAKYAGLGLSGSTAELMDIANATQNSTAASAGVINNNVQTALNALNVSNAPLQSIARSNLQSDNELATAIALLAASGARA